MGYEIETTNIFDKWFASIKDNKFRARILSRLDKLQLGNFGDHKSVSQNLFALRFFFGPGYRAYYTIQNDKIIFLLCGGDKSSQSRDIEKARAIMQALEGDHQ
ncbi:MAG: type II toxin-antitoxin system RelE/ParE family toxin [Deltaproteobacteria bacterium]|nr:type II toxin-antitoxin system RelE/ParE family toxin [Candidatus Anaeroferrophillus wilburensis]MBN2888830.1 type II toxin-antitoxin system RelE/ParE family toxin [Deltaproteobacteria bacterium]